MRLPVMIGVPVYFSVWPYGDHTSTSHPLTPGHSGLLWFYLFLFKFPKFDKAQQKIESLVTLPYKYFNQTIHK